MLNDLPSETEVLNRLVTWGESQASVRALLLTSSRARPEPGVDALSDYDLIVVDTDPEHYERHIAWRSAYGEPLLSWGDLGAVAGATTYFRGVIYADFVKVDYTFWPVTLLEQLVKAAALPDELDAGYRLLLDKDGQAVRLLPPAFKAFRPTPPSAAEFQALMEEFWWGATYVGKSLWRDDLLFAHWVLDNDIKLVALRKLLEWRVALDLGWSLRPGVLGRGLKQRLPPDVWAELAATYTGPEPEAYWDALLRTADLFRRVALEVGQALGYAYPEALDAQIRAYLAAVRGWERPAGF